ncbi:MAG: rhomboid family intramembrane serine protease [Verrucomicrobiales bacterium]
MFHCSHCRTALQRETSPLGVFWRCGSCEGRLFTVAVLRKQLQAAYVNRLWLGARGEKSVEAEALCPSCGHRMREVATPRARSGEGSMHLDVCAGCHVVWFDVHELEAARDDAALPPVVEPEADLPPRAKEILALARIEERRRQYDYEELVLGTPPPDFWSTVVTLFGVPVEVNRRAFSGAPVLTLSVVAAMTIISLLAWSGFPEAIDTWGFLPNDPWRAGGLTSITSFFLHANQFHLLGNALFFLAFGPNVEERLGRAHLAGLLLVSALFGDLVHWLWDPRSAVVTVGASGGVSGVLTLYALLFPRAILVAALRIGIVVRWIRFRAAWGFAIWVVWQAVLVWRQIHGEGHVSGLAHAGGIAVGALWAWPLRRRPRES